MKTVIFMRKRRDEASSIEEIFYPLRSFLGENVEIIELPYSSGSIMNIVKNICFAIKHKGNINHICGEVHFLAIGLGKKSIITVHDVETILTGDKITRFIKKMLWFVLPFKRCGKITCISEATYSELVSKFPSCANKLSVIHNPVNSNLLEAANSTRNKFDETIPVILHVGTAPRKNLERTMPVCASFKCKLLILGKMTDQQKKIARDLHLYYEEHYNIEYSEVLKLYAQALFVSFPSMYEGFGMPILEANTLGIPIVAGDIPVLHEVAGNAALFVDPLSTAEITMAFKRLIEDENLRTDLIDRGKKNSLNFSPENIGKLYQETYKNIQEL